MKPYYRICVFGDEQRFSDFRYLLTAKLNSLLGEFSFKLDREVELQIGNGKEEDLHISTVGLYWGGNSEMNYMKPLNLSRHDPIIPIVSRKSECEKELPAEMLKFNAMETECRNPETSIATAIMECLGLVPDQRKLFVSYRRKDSQDIALQLFNRLSEKQFNVFLDTHEIRPGRIFQDVLWHQMADSDVMIMLDSEGYFDSRWTTEEFTKANEMNIGILRIALPGVECKGELTLAETIKLKNSDICSKGTLSDEVIESITVHVEQLRSKSTAVGISVLKNEIENAIVHDSNAALLDCGNYHRMHLKLQDKCILIYPTTVVPNSEFLNKVADDAMSEGGKQRFAVVYDSQLVLKNYFNHLDWLGKKLDNFCWLTPDSLTVQLENLKNG